jgi:predicted membrane-bound spermidine synthase
VAPFFCLTNSSTPVPNSLEESNSAFYEGLRPWLFLAVGMAVFSEALQILLGGRPAAAAFMPSGSWTNFAYFIGAFCGIPAAMLWIGKAKVPCHPRWTYASIVIGATLYAYQLLFKNSDGLQSPSSTLCLVVAPLGLLALTTAVASYGVNGVRTKNQSRLWARKFFLAMALLGALNVATNAGLHNNRILFPATWDYFVYRIDGAFHGFATDVALLNSLAPPSVQAFVFSIYGLLIFAFYAVVGIAMRQGEVERLHVWRTLVAPFAIAFLLYAVIPVSGPIYAFFSGEFPERMPAALDVVASQVIIPPAYRNGMPSMHLTGAILVLMLSVGLQHRIAIFSSAILVLGTIWATLATGEHYFLDLVVALPYAVFLGSALIWPHRLNHNWKTSAPIWLSGFLFALWIVLLRVLPQWLSHETHLVQALSIASAIIAAIVFYGMVKHSVMQQALSAFKVSVRVHPSEISAPRWIIVLFLVSGMAGLIYEVVFAKALAVTFGSTALASYTVLATYMGGMALGAWLGGYLADRSSTPLRLYAICEAIIGIYAATTPQLFLLVQSIYINLSLDVPPDAHWLTMLRLSLGSVCLGIPTILMGATFPLMFKHLRASGVLSKNAIAPLYAANVIGAAAGSLIAGYLILPAVGRNGGTYIAAILSLMIALYVLDKFKKVFANKLFAPPVIAPTSLVSSVNRRTGLAALAILCIGGAVTLGLEVNSIHLLAIVAGNSVYAFAIMLAMFLAGLGLGSIFGEQMVLRHSRLTLIAWAQFGIAIAVACTAQFWDSLPSYFASYSIYPVALSFSAREAIRAIVCAVAMLPPAFFIGLSYPAAMSLASDWISPTGGAKGIGVASAINTLGNITGVILVGFWLLPDFGSRNTALGVALVALTLGCVALLIDSESLKWSGKKRAGSFFKLIPVGFAVAAVFSFPSQWNFSDLSSGANVYFSAQNWGRVIDHAESVEGGLTTVAKNDNGVSVLLTNGKFQGNDSEGGEMLAQESFALFPLLHTAKRNAALVIGYGTGMTTRVFHELGFAAIDVAELSRDVVKLADRHFEKINHGVSKQPGVAVHYTDGRNFLMTQSKRFDVISIEITSIWFAGAANLYNKDFYHLAKQRLTDDGVLQQWVQLHHMTPIDLVYVIGSVRSEFRYVWLYVRGGQGIIVASNNKISEEYPGESSLKLGRGHSEDELRPAELRKHLLLSPMGIDNLIRNFDPTMQSLVSTDQNLYLEHSTPKGNSLGDVVNSNIRLLARFEIAPSNTQTRGAP